MSDTRLLTPEDAAEQLAFSKAKVYELIRAGRLRAVRLDDAAHWRVPDGAIVEFIASLPSNQEDAPPNRGGAGRHVAT